MSQNNTSSTYHENCAFYSHNPIARRNSSANRRLTALHFGDTFGNSSFKSAPVHENMTSKGVTPAKSKNLSTGHSGPVIIKAHNLKNRVPLSSLANVGSKKDAEIAANSWMTNVSVYSRSDSTAAAVVKPSNDVTGVSAAEPTLPSASDSVEFSLESLFNSDTSIFVTTPTQNPKPMSVESVEKILKSPDRSDDDDVTIVFDSYSSQNVPITPTCDVKLPVTKLSVGESAKAATKVLILRKKPSDNNAKSGTIKTGHSNAAKNVNHINTDQLTITKCIENTEKSKCDPRNGTNQILPASKNVKNDTLECKNIDQNVSHSKILNSKSQVKPVSNHLAAEEGTYVQVENELEKMFAGIDDSSNPSATTKQLNLSATGNMAVPSSRLSSCNKSNSVSIVAKRNKKNVSKTSKPTAASTKIAKDNHKPNSSSSSKESLSSDTMKIIPVIHIEGSKEKPINAHITNSIKSKITEASNAKMPVKRQLENGAPAVKTTTSNFAVKNNNSTSSDATWVCVFCNLSANVVGMAGEAIGDLFGPYFVRMPGQINSQQSQIHSWKTNHPEQVMKKQKLSPTNVSSSDEQNLVEVWAHENCIVWASGVHLIGSKLIGLEEAVMQALETICAHCSNRGASIGCRARNCRSCAHCSCALHMGWKLDTETFISTCRAHSAPSNV